MPNPFESIIAGQQPPGLTVTRGSLFDTFNLGHTPEEEDLALKRSIELDEQQIFSRLSAKAAELSRTATSRADLAKQLLVDPVGMDALSKLPQDKIKPIFDTVLTNLMPDMLTGSVGKDQMLYGMQPGTQTAQPLAQGPAEITTANPFREKISEMTRPGMTFGTQPQMQQPQPGQPTPTPASPQAPQPNVPGVSLMTPQAMVVPKAPTAPAAMEPGTQPQTWYESVIAAEGTGVRGNPYDEVLGYGKWGTPPKPPSQMTLYEVKQFGLKMRQAQAATGIPWDKTSSAMGAFQIVGNTMEDAQRALGLPDSTLYTPEVQRKLADWVVQNQGLDAWEGFKANPQARAQAEATLGLQPKQAQPALTGSRLEMTTAELPDIVTDQDIRKLAEQNDETYFLDAGIAPYLVDWVGRFGRQVDTRKFNHSLAVSWARARQARLRHAVVSTREGREDSLEGEAIRGLVPNFGPTNDPVAALEQGIQLYDYAQNKVRDAIDVINDPNRSTKVKEQADEAVRQWSSVLRELPRRDAMEQLQQDLRTNPTAVEGLLTPQRMWDTLVEEGPVAVGEAIRGSIEKEMARPAKPESLKTMTLDGVNAASPADVKQWVLSTSNAEKAKLPKEVQRAIIAKLRAAGSVQPTR